MNLDLGGYGVYVWPAYGVAGLVMLGLLAASLRALVANERMLDRLQRARLRAEAPLPFDGRGDGG
ncbi:MAG TPA: heme exporter protein CcmD [Alphaproteobacteria bacterium]|jgi:heme exporter protein D